MAHGVYYSTCYNHSCSTLPHSTALGMIAVTTVIKQQKFITSCSWLVNFYTIYQATINNQQSTINQSINQSINNFHCQIERDDVLFQAIIWQFSAVVLNASLSNSVQFALPIHSSTSSKSIFLKTHSSTCKLCVLNACLFTVLHTTHYCHSYH